MILNNLKLDQELDPSLLENLFFSKEAYFYKIFNTFSNLNFV